MARRARFTEQISALVDEETKALIDRLDRDYDTISQADVVREALRHGLPIVSERLRQERAGEPSALPTLG